MPDRFDPDPNKPGWGTFVNGQGKATYDYFPNLAPPTSALSPSASPTPAPIASPASPYSSGATQNMTPAAAPPVPGAAPVAAPAAPGGAPGATPRATQLVDVLKAANPAPRSDGLVKTSQSSSTSITPGRRQADIDRDKATARAGYDTLEQANTARGEGRAARQIEGAKVLGANAASEQQTALNAEARAGLDRYESKRLLSETLAEKDPEVDPSRLVKNMNAGQKVLTVILTALSGGFATVAGQKGNPALDVLNAQINADISAQEKEIDSGRIRRGNLVQAYREQGMDARQAQQAARATYTDAARRVAQAKVEELGAAAHVEDAQALNAGLEAQYSDLVRQLDASGESRTSTTTGSTFERPKPTGGVEEMLKALQLKNGLVDQADAAEIGKVVGREVSPEQAKDIKTDAKEYAKARATNENARRAVKRVADEVGLVLNTETGLYEPGPNGVDVDVLPTEAKRKVERAYSGLKEAQVMRMAREPSARLQDEFGSVMDRPFFDDEIAGQLNAVLQGLSGADDNLRSGYGEGAKLFDSRGAGPSPINSSNVRKPQ